MDRGFLNRLSSLNLHRARLRSVTASRKVIPTVLILIGALMMLYVGSQYAEMYFEQKRMADAWEQEQSQLAGRLDAALAGEADQRPEMNDAHTTCAELLVQDVTRQPLHVHPMIPRCRLEPGVVTLYSWVVAPGACAVCKRRLVFRQSMAVSDKFKEKQE